MDYVRRSARVVLLDPDRAVLLVRSRFRRPVDGVTSAWFVPGGGVEPGETVREAAVREIGEETGLRVKAEDLTHLAFTEGVGQVGPVRGPMRDDVFVAIAPSTELSTERFERHEREAFEAYRWWPIDALRATTAVVFPRELGSALCRYVEESDWPEPVSLPW